MGLIGAQAYAGHGSIEMTLQYWKHDERKLQKKIEQFNTNNQVINSFGEVVDLLKDKRFSEYWKYIVEGDLVKAQLTDSGGICTLPKDLEPCVKNYLCLNCAHHIIVPDFLPVHIDNYKTLLIRQKFAQGKSKTRVREQYDHALKQYETIITHLGGDIEAIKAQIDDGESNLALFLVQLKQTMLKMGISTFEEFKQIVNALEEVPDAAELETEYKRIAL